MYFWRNNAFRSLTEAANCALDFPACNEYSQFCELLEKGLRKEAFAHLAVFIRQAARWPFPQKREFISWLCNFAQEHADTYLLIPHPMYEGFVKPALVEWTKYEPNNSEPYRWLGTVEHLKKAIHLDPADEIARKHLVEILINRLEYSIHELPWGYLGNVGEDLQALSEVESVIAGLSDEDKRSDYQRRVTDIRENITAYLSHTAQT